MDLGTGSGRKLGVVVWAEVGNIGQKKKSFSLLDFFGNPNEGTEGEQRVEGVGVSSEKSYPLYTPFSFSQPPSHSWTAQSLTQLDDRMDTMPSYHEFLNKVAREVIKA